MAENMFIEETKLAMKKEIMRYAENNSISMADDASLSDLQGKCEITDGTLGRNESAKKHIKFQNGKILFLSATPHEFTLSNGTVKYLKAFENVEDHSKIISFLESCEPKEIIDPKYTLKEGGEIKIWNESGNEIDLQFLDYQYVYLVGILLKNVELVKKKSDDRWFANLEPKFMIIKVISDANTSQKLKHEPIEDAKKEIKQQLNNLILNEALKNFCFTVIDQVLDKLNQTLSVTKENLDSSVEF